MRLKFLLIVMLAVSSAGWVRADKRMDEKEVRAQYQRMKHAFEHAEGNLFPTFFADGFYATLARGETRNRAAYLTTLNKAAAYSLPPVYISLAPANIAVTNTTAAAHVAELTSYRLKDRNGSIHALRYAIEFDDQWIKTRQGWRLSARRYAEHFSGVWLDGKPTTYSDAKRSLGLYH
jgi:hypothetical protein